MFVFLGMENKIHHFSPPKEINNEEENITQLKLGSGWAQNIIKPGTRTLARVDASMNSRLQRRGGGYLTFWWVGMCVAPQKGLTELNGMPKRWFTELYGCQN